MADEGRPNTSVWYVGVQQKGKKVVPQDAKPNPALKGVQLAAGQMDIDTATTQFVKGEMADMSMGYYPTGMDYTYPPAREMESLFIQLEKGLDTSQVQTLLDNVKKAEPVNIVLVELWDVKPAKQATRDGQALYPVKVKFFARCYRDHGQLVATAGGEDDLTAPSDAYVYVFGKGAKTQTEGTPTKDQLDAFDQEWKEASK